MQINGQQNCAISRGFIKQCTCGTHFGDTKLVASTTDNPEAASLRISSTFTGVGTMSFSFCSPSRGPTSTIFTHLGRSLISWKNRHLLQWTHRQIPIMFNGDWKSHVKLVKLSNGPGKPTKWYANYCMDMDTCTHLVSSPYPLLIRRGWKISATLLTQWGTACTRNMMVRSGGHFAMMRHRLPLIQHYSTPLITFPIINKRYK